MKIAKLYLIASDNVEPAKKEVEDICRQFAEQLRIDRYAIRSSGIYNPISLGLELRLQMAVIDCLIIYFDTEDKSSIMLSDDNREKFREALDIVKEKTLEAEVDLLEIEEKSGTILQELIDTLYPNREAEKKIKKRLLEYASKNEDRLKARMEEKRQERKEQKSK